MQATTARKPINKAFIFFYIFMMLLGTQSAVDIYLPSLPAMQHTFGVSSAMIQLTMPFYFIATGFPQLIFGTLSDRFGRRNMIILGFIIFTLSSVACMLTHLFMILLLARFFQGLGGASASAMFRAMMRDVFEGPELVKALSYMAILWALIPISMPIVGGYIQETLGWRANFAIIILMGCVTLYLTIFHLPETRDPAHSQAFSLKTIVKNGATLLTSKNFMGYALTAMMLLGLLFGFMTAAPILLQDHIGLSPVEYGWCIFVIALAYMIGGFINTRIAHLFSNIRLLMIALFGLLACSALLLVFALAFHLSVIAIIIPMFSMFCFLGIAYPRTMVGAMTLFPKMAGFSGAMFGTCTFTGVTIITIIIAHLPETSQLPLSILFVSLSLIALAVFFKLAASQPLERRSQG